MQTTSTTDHKFYAVREAQPLLEKGGAILLEAVLQDDWIGWVVRINMPDGSIGRLCAKRTSLPRVYTKPSYLYLEMMELGPTELKFELTTPELTRVKEFQQNRKTRVTAAMAEQDIKIAKFCKTLGVNMASFINILQGERRKPETEAQICETLNLDYATTFPASITEFLNIEYQLPT